MVSKPDNEELLYKNPSFIFSPWGRQRARVLNLQFFLGNLVLEQTCYMTSVKIRWIVEFDWNLIVWNFPHQIHFGSP